MSAFSDLRITCRTLAKSPVFSLTAIAALALGIGANTAIFSVVNEVLLNPAGVTNPERIASLRVKYDKLALASISVSVPDFADVQKSTQMFESAAGVRAQVQNESIVVVRNSTEHRGLCLDDLLNVSAHALRIVVAFAVDHDPMPYTASHEL